MGTHLGIDPSLSDGVYRVTATTSAELASDNGTVSSFSDPVFIGEVGGHFILHSSGLNETKAANYFGAASKRSVPLPISSAACLTSDLLNAWDYANARATLEPSKLAATKARR